MKKETILIIGSEGQLGTEISLALQKTRPNATLVCADIQDKSQHKGRVFRKINVLNHYEIADLFNEYAFQEVYHLAAILSATGEKNPQLAWQVNIDGLLNVLNECVKHKVSKVYWPSSIAVFGNESITQNTPQNGYMNPSTVYGISKLTGELWCQYYIEKHGLDIRSLRYPGIISYKTPPGGGTTDYAVEIYFEAVEKGAYTSFLSAETRLPMMYIEDAIEATLQLMAAPREKLSVRTSYNIAAISFTPEEVATSIQKRMPEFTISYAPDFRQAIASSWPQVIDDTQARKDWGWQPQFDLDRMTEVMLEGIRGNE